MKIACCSLSKLKLADCAGNADEAFRLVVAAAKGGSDLIVFPPHTLTGASCGRATLSSQTVARAEARALERLAAACAAVTAAPVVVGRLDMDRTGSPMSRPAVLCRGEILSVEEAGRLFPRRLVVNSVVSQTDGVPAFEATASDALTVYQLVCPESLTAFDRRRAAIRAAASGGLVVVCSGGAESTTSCVWADDKSVFARGVELAATTFTEPREMLLCETDKAAPVPLPAATETRHDSHPFYVGLSAKVLVARILELQRRALLKRVASLGRTKLILGLSGGLDSTSTLLACVSAYRSAGLPTTEIVCVRMPGPGTSSRTYANAGRLMAGLGVTATEIDVSAAALDHLKRIGQPEGLMDITYEQTQSRHRTLVLLDLANRLNGIVIGTGNMSEAALGWMSYGGDHLSMYALQSGLPKTIVRELVTQAMQASSGELRETLRDILATPVSPELLPPDANGNLRQKTEALVGPYEVIDFWLFHLLADNWDAARLFRSACTRYGSRYDAENLRKWLKGFLSRYFTRKWKSNCFADSPRIYDFGLSPRDGEQLPGDVSPAAWLAELEEVV